MCIHAWPYNSKRSTGMKIILVLSNSKTPKNFLVQSCWKPSTFQMFIISEIQVQFQKFQLCWAEKPEIFPLIKFREYGEGQMKNPHFAGSSDIEWPWWHHGKIHSNTTPSEKNLSRTIFFHQSNLFYACRVYLNTKFIKISSKQVWVVTAFTQTKILALASENHFTV